MIAQHIPQDEIVITATDFDRLQAVVESPRYRSTHASLLEGLKQELERGKVVSGDEVPRAVITMRSRVRVRDLRNDELATFILVYPQEANINEGRLSVLAPLGCALL